MKVGIHLAEVRRLDVSPPKLGLWERDTALDELRRGDRRSIPVDLIDPSASPSGLKHEIAVYIRERVADGYDATSPSRRERLINLSTISDTHVLSRKASGTFAECVQPQQRYLARNHASAESVACARNP